jgi:hypothetical protein
VAPAATPKHVEVIQVIRVICGRGRGVYPDAYRAVTQYWSLDGEFLAEHDPHPTVEDTWPPTPA